MAGRMNRHSVRHFLPSTTNAVSLSHGRQGTIWRGTSWPGYGTTWPDTTLFLWYILAYSVNYRLFCI